MRPVRIRGRHTGGRQGGRGRERLRRAGGWRVLRAVRGSGAAGRRHATSRPRTAPLRRLALAKSTLCSLGNRGLYSKCHPLPTEPTRTINATTLEVNRQKLTRGRNMYNSMSRLSILLCCSNCFSRARRSKLTASRRQYTIVARAAHFFVECL